MEVPLCYLCWREFRYLTYVGVNNGLLERANYKNQTSSLITWQNFHLALWIGHFSTFTKFSNHVVSGSNPSGRKKLFFIFDEIFR